MAVAQTGTEFQVKAAFVLNFLRLIEFPERDANRAGYNICVLATPTALREFQQVGGKTINGKPVTVMRASSSEPSLCDALYIGEEQLEEGKSTLQKLKNTPTVTIGETEDLFADGLIIQFFLQEGRIRFQINLKAVDKQRLKLSSKLMSLARIVGQD